MSRTLLFHASAPSAGCNICMTVLTPSTLSSQTSTATLLGTGSLCIHMLHISGHHVVVQCVVKKHPTPPSTTTQSIRPYVPRCLKLIKLCSHRRRSLHILGNRQERTVFLNHPAVQIPPYRTNIRWESSESDINIHHLIGGRNYNRLPLELLQNNVALSTMDITADCLVGKM